MVSLDEKSFAIFQDALFGAEAHIEALLAENELFKPHNWHLLPHGLFLGDGLEEKIEIVLAKFEKDNKDWNSINESILFLENLVLSNPSLKDSEIAQAGTVQSSYGSSETEKASAQVKPERQAARGSPFTHTQEQTSRGHVQSIQQLSEHFNPQSLRENSEPLIKQWRPLIEDLIDKVNAHEMTLRARLAKVRQLARSTHDPKK
jgi:hypothetical protein